MAQPKGVLPYHLVFLQLFCVMTIVPAILSFYGSYTVLMPHFLATKKYLKLSITGLCMAICSAIVTASLIAIFFRSHLVFASTLRGMLDQTILPFMLSCIHGVLGLILSGFVQWFEENRIKSALQEQNLSMELALLKAKLDPHFLFNTLNNIDVLIEQDSTRASAYLQKLSSLLRFVLYDATSDIIPLQDEIIYIQKYIDVQSLRTPNPDFVHFEVVGRHDSILLPPMLFMPFIENAFKFAEHKKSGMAVSISFTLQESECIFVCENSYIHNTPISKEQSGLGTSLIRRRLELLFPTTHQLTIEDSNNRYRVELRLFGCTHKT